MLWGWDGGGVTAIASRHTPVRIEMYAVQGCRALVASVVQRASKAKVGSGIILQSGAIFKLVRNKLGCSR